MFEVIQVQFCAGRIYITSGESVHVAWLRFHQIANGEFGYCEDS